MGFILDVSGSYNITFYTLSGEEVSKDESVGIVNKLNSGVYSISLNEKLVNDNSNFNVVYKFELDVIDSDYEFINEDDED